MNCTILRPHAPRVEEGWVSWPGELLWPGGGRHEIRFRFTCPDPSAATLRIRPFLLACLVPAMRLGLPLHFELPVDEATLHNLMEWQEAMVCWMPGKLKVVPIRCPVAGEPPKVPTAAGRSLTAFSGGVDSCFTAYRHTAVPESEPFRRCQLTAGLMVHGFDIPEEVCVLGLWDSQGVSDGGGLFPRRGRCTIVLRRQETSPHGYVATHTHFSRMPEGSL